MVDDIDNLSTMNPSQFVGYLYNVMDYKTGAMSFAAYCGKEEAEIEELLTLLKEEAKQFLEILPHQYYEENNLHGLLIEQIKDYDTCLEELERFLPYIDNWATCDMLAVKVVKKHLDTFIDEVYRWM